MTEPQPAEAANEERRRRTAGVESASKPPANANALKAPKDEGRSGLRTQGAVDVAAAEKPGFVRVYKKAPNLERRFDAVDMDENAAQGGGPARPVSKPKGAERVVMPPDAPPAPPTPVRKPDETQDAKSGQDGLEPPAKKEEAKGVAKANAIQPKDDSATESYDEASAQTDVRE